MIVLGFFFLPSQLFAHCASGRRLHKLDGNGIGDEGAMAIGKGLAHCPNLKKLR